MGSSTSAVAAPKPPAAAASPAPHAQDAPRNWVCTALKAQLDNIVQQANQQKVSPTNSWVGLWTVRNADLSKATCALLQSRLRSLRSDIGAAGPAPATLSPGRPSRVRRPSACSRSWRWRRRRPLRCRSRWYSFRRSLTTTRCGCRAPCAATATQQELRRMRIKCNGSAACIKIPAATCLSFVSLFTPSSPRP